MNFSVLMSSYIKDKPEELQLALKSIWDDQTVKPAEIVIVKDGPLTPALDAVIDEFSARAPVKTVPLPQNVGLGKALAAGVENCTCEYIARMDGDDISLPDRFEKQCDFFSKTPDTAICGGMIQEFQGSPDNIISKRILPQDDAEIRTFAKKRNPFNHMSVFFSRKAILDAGNYQHLPGYEDYWLWCRVLASGGKGKNLPDILLLVRAGENMLKRRRGWALAASEVDLAKKQYSIGFLSKIEAIRNIILKASVRLMPVFLLKIIYSNLREKKK